MPGLCRGCHKPVPTFRRTWCSTECWKRHDPNCVKTACFERDKGVCAFCGMDTCRLLMRYRHARHWHDPKKHEYFDRHVFNRAQYNRAWQIYDRHSAQWLRAAEKRREQIKAAGWPLGRNTWWEMDHIIPFSEGGLTVIENVRTLCALCHKKRTQQWRAKIRMKRKPS